MRKKEFITVLLLVFVLLVSGCGKKSESTSVDGDKLKEPSTEVSSDMSLEDAMQNREDITSEESLVEQASEAEETVDEELDPVVSQIIYQSGPFLGKMVKEISLKKPVIVMVENAPAARPQCGLEDASIIYEYLVEGGITRFAALYYENFPERVGPVRSTRPYFIDLALEHKALLLHAGASPEGFNLLASSGVKHIDEISNGEIYWRNSSRRAPHNLYTGSKTVLPVVNETEDVDIVESPFTFQSVGFINTHEAASAYEVEIQYWGGYVVTYKYDETRGNYLRFIDGLPHLMEGGKKLYADNIFIQYVDTKVKDDEGRLEMNFDGSNQAILIKDGFAYTGIWKRDEEGKTHFTDLNGNQRTLNPGQTWVQVVPLSARVEYN